MSTIIFHMDHSFLPVVEAFLNYSWAFELPHGVSFAETRMNDSADDMMRSRYLPKQSGLSYLLHVRLGRLMTKNDHIFRLQESQNESLKNGKELWLSKFTCKVL